MLPMKCPEIILILLICLVFNIYNLKLSKQSNLENFKYTVDKNFTLSEGPIYAKGWLKYLSYNIDENNKPQEFFKNPAFYEQMKNGETKDLTKEDNVGLLNIPDEDHFFFILTENSMNVLSSRKNNLAKTIDILNIDEILKTEEQGEEFTGGIQDHGDFNEGYCFKVISFNEKKKSNIMWDLCARRKNEKVQWMSTLYKLIHKSDKKTTGLIAEENNMKNVIKNLKSGISNETMAEIKRSKGKGVTWVPITMWSECNKKCGGGKSYLQRLCVLPKGSTEKCEGERILTKECNLEPCETMNNGNEITRLKNNTDVSVNSPIMKYSPISRRPIRYEKCIIKEGDLALYIDEGSIKGARIPVRVILNNKTLTAYSNDDYESIIVSHRLSTITGLRKFDKDSSNTCFEIEERKKKTILCTFVTTSKSLSDLALEWQKDILDFIKNCASFYSHELDYIEMNQLTPDQVQKTLDFYQEKEKDQMEKIILKTQQLALQAIEKELKVENIIEKEEEEKQRKLELEVNKQYEKIKKQKEQILQALVEKKKQADIYANKLMIKKKIKQISEQAKREVMKIREDLRARILAKQKDEKRKRELIMNKINSLKKDISKDLLKASKNGNTDMCNPERQTPDIIEYCKVNFENDYSKMNDCVKNDNFCYMCCESEFGDLHLEARSNCYNKCDDFYVYKIKFKSLKVNHDSRELPNQLNKSNKSNPILNKSNKLEKKIKELSKKKKNIPPSEEALKTKFLESKLPKKSKLDANKYNKDDLSKLIEDEKKKELLMNIKEDLSL